MCIKELHNQNGYDPVKVAAFIIGKLLFFTLCFVYFLNIVFFNRIVNEWNSLPNHIREANCIATFKRNVLSFLMYN